MRDRDDEVYSSKAAFRELADAADKTLAKVREIKEDEATKAEIEKLKRKAKSYKRVLTDEFKKWYNSLG